MKFGPLTVSQAEGAIAAHSLRFAGGVIRKGTRLSAADLARLAEAGVTEIVAARLDEGDVHEDAAAEIVARSVAGPGIRVEAPATGRANLFAEAAGLVVVDRAAVDRLNRLDPGITLATLPEFAPAEQGRMVATVKVIPFAVPGTAIAAATGQDNPALRLATWKGLKVALVQTRLPGTKESVLDKTRKIFEERLGRGGASLATEARTPHEEMPLSLALREAAATVDLVVCFGASAITDRADVIPAAVVEAGGTVRHFGMPVDPGNLLLLGKLGGKPVLGAPGCARSPVENGFDWVLNRLLAGLDVTPDDVTGMGVGGLLMEIVSRPQPRERAKPAQAPVAAIVLAAGQSRRMGGPNKLLARFDGVPLVRRSVEATLASRASPVIVVTGHMEAETRAALDGLDVVLVHNPAYAEGLSSSLKCGLAAVPEEASGALVHLADMPGIDAAVIDRLIDAFCAGEGPAIVLPTVSGKRGNPVLWSRHFFAELGSVTGDVGARHLIGRHEDAVRRIEIGAAAALDVDTREALEAAGGILETPKE